MVTKVELKHVNIAQTRTFARDVFWSNQKDVQKVINENANELIALAQHQTQTINYGIEKMGETTILRGSKHLSGMITNAFVQIADNLLFDIQVEINGITDNIRFSGTEKAGKLKIFNIFNNNISFHEDIVVETSSDRKIIVSVTLESTEKGDE